MLRGFIVNMVDSLQKRTWRNSSTFGTLHSRFLNHRHNCLDTQDTTYTLDSRHQQEKRAFQQYRQSASCVLCNDNPAAGEPHCRQTIIGIRTEFAEMLAPG
jgi:hypothetical protein